jgi:hypothetical protein
MSVTMVVADRVTTGMVEPYLDLLLPCSIVVVVVVVVAIYFH